MILLLSLTVAMLFGSGAYLMMKRDLIRVAAGITLISNSAVLFIIAAALQRGEAPIYPLPSDGLISDPLVQAMALTAIVISFGFTTLLLSLIYRLYTQHHSVDQEDLADAEREADGELEPEQIWR
ncbi:MAG TPA: sodium:proton antiporter [Nitrolancea sp.]